MWSLEPCPTKTLWGVWRIRLVQDTWVLNNVWGGFVVNELIICGVGLIWEIAYWGFDHGVLIPRWSMQHLLRPGGIEVARPGKLELAIFLTTTVVGSISSMSSTIATLRGVSSGAVGTEWPFIDYGHCLVPCCVAPWRWHMHHHCLASVVGDGECRGTLGTLAVI